MRASSADMTDLGSCARFAALLRRLGARVRVAGLPPPDGQITPEGARPRPLDVRVVAHSRQQPPAAGCERRGHLGLVSPSPCGCCVSLHATTASSTAESPASCFWPTQRLKSTGDVGASNPWLRTQAISVAGSGPGSAGVRRAGPAGIERRTERARVSRFSVFEPRLQLRGAGRCTRQPVFGEAPDRSAHLGALVGARRARVTYRRQCHDRCRSEGRRGGRGEQRHRQSAHHLSSRTGLGLTAPAGDDHGRKRR